MRMCFSEKVIEFLRQSTYFQKISVIKHHTERFSNMKFTGGHLPLQLAPHCVNVGVSPSVEATSETIAIHF
jgi:hypothetical protein